MAAPIPLLAPVTTAVGEEEIEVTGSFCWTRGTLPRVGLRTAAGLIGLVGGLTWISVLVFDRAGGPVLVDTLTWIGLFLLTVATLVAGASLVSSSAAWLRVIVSVCFTVLIGSIVSLVAETADDQVTYATFGAVAALVSAVVLARTERTSSGSHAR